MAQFAQLDTNNIVLRVSVVNNSDTGGGDLSQENVGIGYLKGIHGASTNWKQTSYNRNFRGNYAGIGMTYMTGVQTLGVASTDIFIIQQPYPSWGLSTTASRWIPPANPGEHPTLSESERNIKSYTWSESNYNSDPATAWVLNNG